MSSSRREPYGERVAALRGLRHAVLYGVLAVAVWLWAERAWPDEWLEPGEQERDRIVRAATAVLGAIAAWGLATCVFHAVRWARARWWERMLDDPDQAHRVPPLKSHVAAVPPEPGGCALLALAVLLGLAGAGLIGYGVLALDGQVDRLHNDGEDQTWSMIVFGAVLLVAAAFAIRRVRKWQVARRVERLSNDSALLQRRGQAPSVAGSADTNMRAAVIPRLDVRFDPVGTQPLDARHAPTGTFGAPPREILYFRLFDNVQGTDRFVKSAWRRLGPIHILRSASQVDADELEAAEESGSVASLFISTPAELDEALRRQASGRIATPRPEGLGARLRWAFDTQQGIYPVHALLCHGSFWQTAVDLLLERMDLVVIDLTGYRPEYAGTRFELQRVIDRYPIEQVTLLAGYGSDQQFLRAQIGSMWRHMAEGSPNAGTGSRSVRVVVVD